MTPGNMVDAGCGVDGVTFNGVKEFVRSKRSPGAWGVGGENIGVVVCSVSRMLCCPTREAEEP